MKLSNNKHSLQSVDLQKGFSSILILVIVTVLVLGGIYIYQKQNKTSNSLAQQTVKPSTGNNEVNSVDQTNWVTYTSPKYNPFYTDQQLQDEIQRWKSLGEDPNRISSLQYIQFSLKLPPEWKQDYATKGLDGRIDEFGAGFIFTNNNLEIRIAKFYAPGGNLCDQTAWGNDYKDIKTNFATFRRMKDFENTKYIPKGDVRFVLCIKDANGFGSNTPLGVINYTLPLKYSVKDLNQMDMIISTIEKLK